MSTERWRKRGATVIVCCDVFERRTDANTRKARKETLLFGAKYRRKNKKHHSLFQGGRPREGTAGKTGRRGGIVGIRPAEKRLLRHARGAGPSRGLRLP